MRYSKGTEGGNMRAIEFDSIITDGVIPIPEQYKNILPDSVKVLVFPSAGTQTKNQNAGMDWLGKIYKVESFKPGTREDLYDR
jgi:hypothetical protein